MHARVTSILLTGYYSFTSWATDRHHIPSIYGSNCQTSVTFSDKRANTVSNTTGITVGFYRTLYRTVNLSAKAQGTTVIIVLKALKRLETSSHIRVRSHYLIIAQNSRFVIERATCTFDMMMRSFAIVVLQATICLAFSPSQRSRPWRFNWAVSEYHPIRSPVHVLKNPKDAERSRNHNGPSLRARLGENQPEESVSKLHLSMGSTNEVAPISYDEVAPISYDDYQDRIARILALKSFVVFKDLDDTEIIQLADALEPVEVSKMQDIITKEDTEDKSMYFVKEGSLRCYDPETKEKFNTVEKGGYVGELALFLSRPRAVSVRGNEDNTILWKLDRKYTSEYPVGKSLSKYLVKQYKTKRSIQDYVDIMKLNLRPKKKKVGPHSTISVLTSGACLLHL